MKSNAQKIIKEVKDLQTVEATAEWWCKLMKEEIDTKDELLVEAIKEVAEKYWEQLYESCEVYLPEPPYLGRLKQDEAEKMRKVIKQYGYETPDDFNKNLFCFQAETIGHASNFGLFIV